MANKLSTAIDPGFIEKVKRTLIDIYDEFTCAHEEDPEIRKKKGVYPNIEMIHKKFPFKVSIPLLRDVRRQLMEDGEILPFGGRRGNPLQVQSPSPEEILRPVQDDPEEVAKWAPILAVAHEFREPPKDPASKNAAPGKKPVPENRYVKKTYRFSSTFKRRNYTEIEQDGLL